MKLTTWIKVLVVTFEISSGILLVLGRMENAIYMIVWAAVIQQLLIIETIKERNQ